MSQHGIPIYNVPLLREWRGLTQAALAQAADVSVSALWLWEQGKTNPLPPMLRRLARALGVSEAVLRTPNPVLALLAAHLCDAPEGEEAPPPSASWRALMTRLQRAQTPVPL